MARDGQRDALCVWSQKQLCCGRAIAVMREYAKKQASEPNCLENVRKNHTCTTAARERK